jgi:hypothetical protein
VNDLCKTAGKQFFATFTAFLRGKSLSSKLLSSILTPETGHLTPRPKTCLLHLLLQAHIGGAFLTRFHLLGLFPNRLHALRVRVIVEFFARRPREGISLGHFTDG